MRSHGVTRANDCSTLWPCSYGNPKLPPSQPSGVCYKNSCTPQLQIGLDGSLPTKISGRTMVEALTIGSEEIASWPLNELNLSRFMAPNDILWPLPPARCSLGASDVHVWAAHLDLNLEALARLAAILSEEEQQRAARLRFERHHNRFIAARGILRSLLATYLDYAPDLLQFGYGPNGKPALSGPFASSGLSFNLAHSENLALIAV